MQNVRVAGFEWDAGNWPKCGKHGVAKAQIEAMFSKVPAVYPDPAHSTAEERFLAIGSSGDGHFLFVAFTLRTRGQEVLIRPISARFMHRKEIEHYERQRKAARTAPTQDGRRGGAVYR
ncbi:BrnT family toxin [Thioalkalivibrio sp.]|uniref:BrnT family toxin n=1 Tax=Thioalkalivibrio sp. TaxID=2093813 RepID=UPI0012D669CF|nr:BrnT family toxin [Thioalkalivibrio sp.]TVP83180.1 MAG: BrnT family toxin [Thioalkalivibrio sp.]